MVSRIRIPDIPGLPDIGDLWDRVQSLVDQAAGNIFNGLVSYIWQPIRPYLDDVFKVAVEATNLAASAGGLSSLITGRLVHFFRNGPEIVGGWILRSFLQWIDAMVDLVEDYIDSHWDDAI